MSTDIRSRKLYVNPKSMAVDRSNYYKAKADPMSKARVKMFDALAAVPTAIWVGPHYPFKQDGNYDKLASEIDEILDDAGDELVTLVAYNLPWRDGGDGYSANSEVAKNYDEYAIYSDAFASGLRGHPAQIVIVEPDGLAMAGDLSDSVEAERYRCEAHIAAAIRYAGSLPFFDSGDSDWQSASTMVERLVRAGMTRDAGIGIALNVSHHELLRNEQAFAKEIEAGLGFPIEHVLDSCKAGTGPRKKHPLLHAHSYWCNVVGSGYGVRPNLRPSQSAFRGCKAFLWGKGPCSSDGTFRGAPEAGKPDDEGAVDRFLLANPPFDVVF